MVTAVTNPYLVATLGAVTSNPFAPAGSLYGTLTPPPVAANWTWGHQGTATLLDGGDQNVVLSQPGSGGGSADNRSWAYVASPSSSGTWLLTAGLFFSFFPTQRSSAGIVVGDSAGKFIEMAVLWNTDNNMQLGKFTNASTLSATYQDFNLYPLATTQLLFFHINVDATNITWAYSADGVYANGTIVDVRAKGDFLADHGRIGLSVNAQNSDSLRGRSTINLFDWRLQ